MRSRIQTKRKIFLGCRLNVRQTPKSRSATETRLVECAAEGLRRSRGRELMRDVSRDRSQQRFVVCERCCFASVVCERCNFVSEEERGEARLGSMTCCYIVDR